MRSVILTTLVLAMTAPYAFCATVQTADNVLADGSAYLWVEAESASEGLGVDESDTGFIPVTVANPIKTIAVVKGDLDALPADSNASGGAAILDNLGPGGPVTWELQFEIPATYYLYMHYSFFNRDDNTNYGNEDSIYIPPAFNLDARDGWIGFQGVNEFDEPKEGNSTRDGWVPLGKTIVSAGEEEVHNSTDEDFWDGQFHWSRMAVTVDVDENDAFVDGFGHKIQYEVADGDVGQILTFNIANREEYGAIDGMLFSTSDELLDDYTQEQMDEFFLNLGQGGIEGDFDGSGVLDIADINQLSAEVAGGANNAQFDLNGDGAVDSGDLTTWVSGLRNTYFGDANLDGEFNSGDLVTAVSAGKFETGEAAGWDEGDWNGDGFFGSGDLVAAFADGGYETGPRAATASVPEPSSVLLCVLGLGLLGRFRRR